MPGALEGVRILDCTQIIAGPLAGSLLSEMGADVVKVEPLEGEPWRLQAEVIPKESKGFLVQNRGKRGLALNFKDPRSAPIRDALIAWADVLLDQLPPGCARTARHRLRISPPRQADDHLRREHSLRKARSRCESPRLRHRRPGDERPHDVQPERSEWSADADRLRSGGCRHRCRPRVGDHRRPLPPRAHGRGPGDQLVALALLARPAGGLTRGCRTRCRGPRKAAGDHRRLA